MYQTPIQDCYIFLFYYKIAVGASSDPCDSKFAGVAPLTEYETLNMSKYIKSIGDKLFAYISFHSFTQLLMVPYGYTTEHLDNYNETVCYVQLNF